MDTGATLARNDAPTLADWHQQLDAATDRLGRPLAESLHSSQDGLRGVDTFSPAPAVGVVALDDGLGRTVAATSFATEATIQQLQAAHDRLKLVVDATCVPLPDDVDHLLLGSAAAASNGDSTEARRSALEAGRLVEHHPAVAFALARSYVADGSDLEAAEAFNRAAQLAQPFSKVLGRLATLLSAQLFDSAGHRSLALSTLGEALGGQPGSPRLNLALGRRGSNDHLVRALVADPTMVLDVTANPFSGRESVRAATARLERDVKVLTVTARSLSALTASVDGGLHDEQPESGCPLQAFALAGVRRNELAKATLTMSDSMHSRLDDLSAVTGTARPPRARWLQRFGKSAANDDTHRVFVTTSASLGGVDLARRVARNGREV